MAESGRPVSKLFPPVGAIPTDPVLTADSLLPLSKSSTTMVTGHLQSEELRKSSNDATCLRRDPQNGSEGPAQAGGHSAGCPPDHAKLRNAPHPHSTAQVHVSQGTGAHGDAVNHQHERAGRGSLLGFREGASSSQRELRGVGQSLAPAKLPVERGHLDSLHVCKEGTSLRQPSLRHSETGGSPQQGREHSGREDPEQPLPVQVCKQAVQLQQSNTVTTSCRGSSTTQQTQQGCIQVCVSGPPAAAVEGGAREASSEPKHPAFEEAVCCSSFVHHALEDTFAAYCHPQPIPVPTQLLPRLADGEYWGPNLLALPRLISSVSETGLDGKRFLHCCTLDCSWPGPLRPTGNLPPYAGGGEEGRTTRDAGTMTLRRQLRDVGVQAGRGLELPPPHVFPEVCLVEEEVNGLEGAAAGQKSPVKEVKWDVEGMTWEVYGAAVDPEDLGLAIQRHLELQIKETASRAAKLSRQNTATSCHSTASGRRRKRGGLMGSFRSPGCCSRSSTAVD